MLPCSLSPSSLIALTVNTSSSHSSRKVPRRRLACCTGILMLVSLIVSSSSRSNPFERISVTLYPVIGCSGHENTGFHIMIRISSTTSNTGLGAWSGPIYGSKRLEKNYHNLAYPSQ